MRKQQQFGNSCGAAALLCAAMELGIRHLPRLGGINLGQPLQANGQCESALYALTSGALTGGYSRPLDFDKLGYSMPHNVAIAARELGLAVQIYSSGPLARLLAYGYPSAEAQCIKAGFPILRAAPPALAAHQRALKVMMTFVVGLHYVMRRPDGTYMDPGDGRDFASFEALNSWSKTYNHSGITLVLENPPTAAAA
ncbi:hypothetical protein [Pseudomonas sp. NPDC089401]|uniref:hypothetical protein n=1 Tax=Pseudomonas sp. NPDC089401 TaxID=3364462 RepID=UPI003807BFE0